MQCGSYELSLPTSLFFQIAAEVILALRPYIKQNLRTMRQIMILAEFRLLAIPTFLIAWKSIFAPSF